MRRELGKEKHIKRERESENKIKEKEKQKHGSDRKRNTRSMYVCMYVLEK